MRRPYSAIADRDAVGFANPSGTIPPATPCLSGRPQDLGGLREVVAEIEADGLEPGGVRSGLRILARWLVRLQLKDGKSTASAPSCGRRPHLDLTLVPDPIPHQDDETIR